MGPDGNRLFEVNLIWSVGVDNNFAKLHLILYINLALAGIGFVKIMIILMIMMMMMVTDDDDGGW